MVKANKEQKPVQFLVSLMPINEFVTLDKLPDRFRLVAGGCGIKVVDCVPVNQTASDRPQETQQA